MKRTVVIRANTSGPRLPGRALLPLRDEPLLVRMIERVRAAKTRFDLVIATSRSSRDDEILALARGLDIPIFRGRSGDPFEDVRDVGAVFGAEAIASLSCDSPLIDPFIIDEVFATFERTRCDYASNLHPATFPAGMGVEVMRTSALARSGEPLWRHPDLFHIENVRFFGTDLSRTVRFVVERPEDYVLCRSIFRALYTPDRPVFSLRRMLELLASDTDLLEDEMLEPASLTLPALRLGAAAL